jgi:predicted membrane protein
MDLLKYLCAEGWTGKARALETEEGECLLSLILHGFPNFVMNFLQLYFWIVGLSFNEFTVSEQLEFLNIADQTLLIVSFILRPFILSWCSCYSNLLILIWVLGCSNTVLYWGP